MAVAALPVISWSATFRLEDQWGKPQIIQFPLATPLAIFVLADREGAAQVEQWVRPLYERYEAGVPIYGVAVLPDIPFFVRPFVRSLFRHNLKEPLLLDWDCAFSDHFGFTAGSVMVLVLDSNARIVHRSVGSVSPEKLRRCFRAVDAKIGRQQENG